jgi:hypothetical protein
VPYGVGRQGCDEILRHEVSKCKSSSINTRVVDEELSECHICRLVQCSSCMTIQLPFHHSLTSICCILRSLSDWTHALILSRLSTFNSVARMFCIPACSLVGSLRVDITVFPRFCRDRARPSPIPLRSNSTATACNLRLVVDRLIVVHLPPPVTTHVFPTIALAAIVDMRIQRRGMLAKRTDKSFTNQLDNKLETGLKIPVRGNGSPGHWCCHQRRD